MFSQSHHYFRSVSFVLILTQLHQSNRDELPHWCIYPVRQGCSLRSIWLCPPGRIGGGWQGLDKSAGCHRPPGKSFESVPSRSLKITNRFQRPTIWTMKQKGFQFIQTLENAKFTDNFN